MKTILILVYSFRYIHIKAYNYNFLEGHIKSNYLNKQNLMHVTHLNINSIYWLPASSLRRFLGYMPNLQSLYILDTALSVTVADLETYNKLKKVSHNNSHCKILISF